MKKDNRILSAAEQAKLDREQVEQLNGELTMNESNDSEVIECGLSNPCQFGAHNPYFNEKKTI